MFNAPDKTWLIPYLEGTLDDARRTRLEARLRADDALASELEALRAATERLRALAASDQTTPAAPSLWPGVRARLELQARPVRAPRRRLLWAGGLAASCALAAVAVVALKPSPRLAPAAMPEAASSVASVPIVRPRAVSKKIAVPMDAVKIAAAPRSKAAPVRRPDSLRFAQRAVVPPGTPLRPPLSRSAPSAPSVARSPARPAASTARPTLMASRDVGSESANAKDVPLGLSAESAPQVKTQASPVNPAGSAPGSRSFGGGASGKRSAADGSGAAGAAGREAQAPAAVKARINKDEIKAAPTVKPPALTVKPPAPLAETVSDGVRLNGLTQARQRQKADTNGLALGLWRRGETRLALNGWQDALERAVKPPLYGDESGVKLASQTLQSVTDAGALDAFRQLLERRRTQLPRDVVLARLLAVVYDFSGDAARARDAWERVAKTGKASSQDWLQLAEAEDKMGDGEAAKAAYQRVLDAVGPSASKDAARKRLAEPPKVKAAP